MLEPPEWQALYATIHHKNYPHSYPPTLGEAVGWIAKLGGFLGRKHDGVPGVKTLWRGLRRLDNIMMGWLLSCSASKTHIVWYNMIIFRKSQCLLKTSSVLRQRKLCNKH